MQRSDARPALGRHAIVAVMLFHAIGSSQFRTGLDSAASPPSIHLDIGPDEAVKWNRSAAFVVQASSTSKRPARPCGDHPLLVGR